MSNRRSGFLAPEVRYAGTDLDPTRRRKDSPPTVNPLNGVPFGQEKTREDYLARSAWEYDQASRLRLAQYPLGYQALAEGHERAAKEYEKAAESREPSRAKGRRSHATKGKSASKTADIILRPATDETYAVNPVPSNDAVRTRLRRAGISWFLGFDPKSAADRAEIERRIAEHVGSDITVAWDSPFPRVASHATRPSRRAHATIGDVEDAAPTRGSLSPKIKQALRKLYDLKVKLRTNQTKNPFITAWIPFEGNRPSSSRFPADLRNTALDVIYGEAFARNHSDPSAGNVEGHSISMRGSEWIETFRRLGQQL